MYDLLFVTKDMPNSFFHSLSRKRGSWSNRHSVWVWMSKASNWFKLKIKYTMGYIFAPLHLHRLLFINRAICDYVFFCRFVCTRAFRSSSVGIFSFFYFHSSFFCRHLLLGYRLVPFLSLAVNHKSSTKRFWDISISPHHIILLSWITTNLSCFSSLTHTNSLLALNPIQCAVVWFGVCIKSLPMLVYDRRNAYIFRKNSNPLVLFFAFMCVSFSLLLFFSSWFFSYCWLGFTLWSDWCCVLHFSLVCCLFNAHMCAIILIWWSQIIKSPSFTSNSVNQWLFFHSPAFFSVRFSTVCEHYVYAKDLCRFLVRVFLLFNFLSDLGKFWNLKKGNNNIMDF